MRTRLGNRWKRLFVRVEKALDLQETALGVFLDTEGAFNNTCYDTICDVLVRHGSEYTIVRWIRATLADRVAVATLNEFSVGLAISKGCPQRSVLSPLLWCLVVDDLLARLSGGGVFIQGYADDICLLAVGKFPNTVSGLMQWALLTVEAWCNEVGLSVNSERLGSLHVPEKGSSRGSLNHISLGLNSISRGRSSILGLFWILGWPGQSKWRSR